MPGCTRLFRYASYGSLAGYRPLADTPFCARLCARHSGGHTGPPLHVYAHTPGGAASNAAEIALRETYGNLNACPRTIADPVFKPTSENAVAPNADETALRETYGNLNAWPCSLVALYPSKNSSDYEKLEKLCQS